MRLKSHKILILSAIMISGCDCWLHRAKCSGKTTFTPHDFCFLVTFHLFFGEVMVSFFSELLSPRTKYFLYLTLLEQTTTWVHYSIKPCVPLNELPSEYCWPIPGFSPWMPNHSAHLVVPQLLHWRFNTRPDDKDSNRNKSTGVWTLLWQIRRSRGPIRLC